VKIALVTSRATSLMEVARAIAYVARRRGLQPVILEYAPSPVDMKRMAGMVIVVMTMNPLLSRSWFLAARDYNKENIPSWIYTTTEGRLPKRYVKPWMQRDLVFIANSQYTREKLEEAGLTVVDVVPHGIVMSEVEQAVKLAETARKHLESRLGSGVYYVTVASSHRRKGHELYARAIMLARQECEECKFYILTGQEATVYYSDIEGVYVDPRFGQLSRMEVLALMAAADWYVQPSLAEGFGLPVLEAQAVGTPCIHPAYPPLTEHSHKDNLWVPYEQVIYDPMGEGIEYELHIYRADEMAKTILKAYDITVNKKDEYKALSERVREHAKQYDAEKVYGRLLDSISEVEELG